MKIMAQNDDMGIDPYGGIVIFDDIEEFDDNSCTVKTGRFIIVMADINNVEKNLGHVYAITSYGSHGMVGIRVTPNWANIEDIEYDSN